MNQLIILVLIEKLAFDNLLNCILALKDVFAKKKKKKKKILTNFQISCSAVIVRCWKLSDRCVSSTLASIHMAVAANWMAPHVPVTSQGQWKEMAAESPLFHLFSLLVTSVTVWLKFA